MLPSYNSLLAEESYRLCSWLHDSALPLWLSNGFSENDGYSESLTLDGQATVVHRRCRIHPRQVYCFAAAGARGWAGDWSGPVRLGLQYFDRVYRLRSGFYGALATRDGVLIDETFDLYNQAFAVLAFCYTAKALPETAKTMSQRSEALLSALRTKYAHSEAGFNEAVPARLPLRSNPHMHLFEAALACEEQHGFDRQTWFDLADELAALCMRRFVDSETGALREFFDGTWRPAGGEKGRIVEPGHQFEWAWLLARWAKRRNNAGALSTAKRLFQIGVDHGICPQRQVAVMALLDDFSIDDSMARLWPQAEWLKAALRLAALSEGQERERYLASALQAVTAFRLFLDAPRAGLWRDKLDQDSVFVQEAAPTSSLYHIVCAVYELEDRMAELMAEPHSSL